MRPSRRGRTMPVGVLSSVARAVTSNVAGALTSRAAGQIAMVGLFVDADDAVIADALVAAKLNALQLHGSESPERVAQLRAVWQAGVEGAARRQRQRCRTRRSLCRGGGLDLVRRQDPQRRAARRHGVGVRLVAAGRISRCLAVGAGRRAKSDECCRAIARTGAPLVDTSSGVSAPALHRPVTAPYSFPPSAAYLLRRISP